MERSDLHIYKYGASGHLKHERSILFIIMRVPRWLKIWKRPKTTAALIIVLLIVAAVVVGFRNLNSPAQGTITTQTPVAADNKLPSGNNAYSDSVISFEYPASYQTKPAARQSGYLDSVSLITSQRRDRYVSIGVYPGTLASDSGVSYRQLHTEIYKKQPSTPQQLVFSKLDGTEYTGFIQIGPNVISISITSVSPVDETADYHTIADSLRLK